MVAGFYLEYKRIGIVEVLKKRLNDITPLLKMIGLIMSASRQNSFVTQRRGNKSWAKRGIPGRQVKNMPGLILDLIKIRTVRARRFDARPALRDRDHLMKSIKTLRVTDNSVAVGSTLDYASKQFFGKTTIIPLPMSLRDTLRNYLERNPHLKKELGFLFNLDFYETTPIPRDFMTFTKTEVKDIGAAARSYMRGDL